MMDRKLTIDRRATLMWLSASMAAACSPGQERANRQGLELNLPDQLLDPKDAMPVRARALSGYGKDPDLFDDQSPWPRIMSERQKSVSAALADVILPKVDEFPAPSDVGITEFIDEWVSAPYPDQIADCSVILEGIAMIDDTAKLAGATGFVEAGNPLKITILTQFSIKGGNAAQQRRRIFFETFRRLVLGAYYTTQIGFDAIGYIGNVAMLEFPGPSPDIVSTLDRRLKRVGL